MFSKSIRSKVFRGLFAAIMFMGLAGLTPPPTTNGDCVTALGIVCPPTNPLG